MIINETDRALPYSSEVSLIGTSIVRGSEPKNCYLNLNFTLVENISVSELYN